MVKNIPNILTISRIFIIPIIVAAFYLPNPLSNQITALLFVAASVTDFLDGYLARAWDLQSNFGRFLDPVADKILVAVIILMLVHKDRADILPAVAIISREILVSGLREFISELHKSMPVTKLAKWKTFIQLIAIFLLLLGNEAIPNLHGIELIGRISLWAAAVITIYTGYAYVKAARKYLLE